LATTTRLTEWWKPKAASLMGVVYAAILITRLPFDYALALMAPSLITILGIGSFGHVVNDWCDMRIDMLAGKPNRLCGTSRQKRIGLAVAVLAVALVPWSLLPADFLSMALLAAELSLLVTYAVPPIRLKERLFAAVFADSGYAYAIPSVLAAHTFFLAAGRNDNWWLLASLFAFQLSHGIRHFLNHIALDWINDRRTGTVTLATVKGRRFVHHFIRRTVLPLELLALLSYLLVLTTHLPYLALIVTGGFALLISLPAVLAVGRRYPLIIYRFSGSPVDRVQQDILPLALLAYLVLYDWRFCSLAVLHSLLFYAHGVRQSVLNAITRFVGICLVAVRRRQDLVGLKGSMHTQTQTPPVIPRPARTRSRDGAADFRAPSIAVININKAKYTETFIQGVVAHLNFRCYYLYGGELPQFDDDDRHFLSNWPSLQSLARFLETALRLEENHFLKNSISGYLQAKKVQLVIAEFGPVGVQMLPITRDLGLPLIVCFHGYDAFHRQTIQQCAGQYERLFREAALIVAVSERMASRLIELGAHRDKLLHLPAFVDLSLFRYSKEGRIASRFLAIGRFAETKAPHLTILAFEIVARTLPQAELVMIGKDGGGELYEACIILVRALGLERRIHFKGVLPHEKVAEEMRIAGVFVQHSVTTPENGDREGKPVAVMEAMACGLPVVATRHSGIDELIQHEVTGLLVPEYDIEAMAGAMIRAAKDDNLRHRLGRAASAAMHSHPLISRHVEILEDAIRRCSAVA
jgi:glycosyltransferase involved in cell wall biosynthesis